MKLALAFILIGVAIFWEEIYNFFQGPPPPPPGATS